MAKTNIPTSSEEVRLVMKDYILKKKFSFSEAALDYISEDMFLYFSSKDWVGVKYWPAIAMRWVLNHVTKFGEEPIPTTPSNNMPIGETLKDKTLKEQRDNNDI